MQASSLSLNQSADVAMLFKLNLLKAPVAATFVFGDGRQGRDAPLLDRSRAAASEDHGVFAVLFVVVPVEF